MAYGRSRRRPPVGPGGRTGRPRNMRRGRRNAIPRPGPGMAPPNTPPVRGGRSKRGRRVRPEALSHFRTGRGNVGGGAGTRGGAGIVDCVQNPTHPSCRSARDQVMSRPDNFGPCNPPCVSMWDGTCNCDGGSTF